MENSESKQVREANIQRIAEYLSNKGLRPKLVTGLQLFVDLSDTLYCIHQSDDGYYHIFSLVPKNQFFVPLDNVLAYEKVNRSSQGVKIVRADASRLYVGFEALYSDVEHLLGVLDKMFELIFNAIVKCVAISKYLFRKNNGPEAEWDDKDAETLLKICDGAWKDYKERQKNGGDPVGGFENECERAYGEDDGLWLGGNGEAWKDDGEAWEDAGEAWEDDGEAWEDDGEAWEDDGEAWEDDGEAWKDGGNAWDNDGEAWKDGGNAWDNDGEAWKDGGNAWDNDGEAWKDGGNAWDNDGEAWKDDGEEWPERLESWVVEEEHWNGGEGEALEKSDGPCADDEKPLTNGDPWANGIPWADGMFSRKEDRDPWNNGKGPWADGE